jgi:salicylate hydroxylase
MHNVLLDTVRAPSSRGVGPKGNVIVNYKALEIDYENGAVNFENGNIATVDLIIAADGIRESQHRTLVCIF